MDQVQTLGQLNDHLGQVKEKELIKQYTSLKIGGPARYYYEADSSENLIKSVETARELNLAYFILGGGSNILVADSGFNGLVIHAANRNFRLHGEKFYVEAGVFCPEIAKESVNDGFTGLEWMAAIPGTIGGAVYGNAGCFGYSMKDCVSKVDVFRNREKKRLLKKECQFAYRSSIFQRTKDLILSAELTVTPGNKKKSLEKIKQYLEQKKQTQPLGEPSTGSVFKNFKIKNEKDIEILKRHAKIPEEYIKNGILPAGWLLDQVGAKGMNIGGIEVSDKHANFIINRGSGTADQYIQLMSKLKMLVRDELGIQLVEEIEFIGF